MRGQFMAGAVPLAFLLSAVGLAGSALAADAPPLKTPAVLSEQAAKATLLTLTDLEQMALAGNPTLAQAAANVEASRGRALQSGLYPNPTVGYEGNLMGVAGTAGEMQGLFIDQTVITAGKLRLNRARFGQEVSQMEAQALAQQYRVLNGVRTRYYQLLAMQRLLDVRADLLKVAEDAAATTQQLQNVGAANKPDVLQARIEARQEKVALENARAFYEAAWKQLAAFVGNPYLPLGRLQGDLEGPGSAPDYDAALAHLLEASPELQVVRAELTRNQIGLKREQVEPIPNLQVRVSNGYDFETRNDVTSVQLGVRLPLFDKNQGNIQTARAQLAYTQQNVCRVELSLRQRLARTHARYRAALAVVEEFKSHSLPDAKEAYELYLDSFRNRTAAWPQVLVAQRTYFQISVDYVEALEQLRQSETAILGLLLVDGLDEPAGSPSEGRTQQREQQTGTSGDLADPIRSQSGRGLEDRMGGPGG
jgi:outer membrane protein, heavy metal efflux system